MTDLEKLTTETRNEKTMHLDDMTVLEILQTMNDEDKQVPLAVEKALPQIAKVVEQIIQAFNQHGRLIYMGAGTSGRLGVLDAAECVPTFGTEPELVQGLIAGGRKAMTMAVEGAEDSRALAKEDLQAISLTKKDVVVGIAASGRTPYAIGGLDYAQAAGAATASIACNREAEISKHAKFPIEVEVGSEVLTGSTRLKSGTAQKLVLNMLSTAAMIGIGKVYKNLMVDVRPTNEKLVARSYRIIMQATGCTEKLAKEFFEKAGGDVKVAIVMILKAVDRETAEKRLEAGRGFIREAL